LADVRDLTANFVHDPQQLCFICGATIVGCARAQSVLGFALRNVEEGRKHRVAALVALEAEFFELIDCPTKKMSVRETESYLATRQLRI
jgi:hypothetical protein